MRIINATLLVFMLLPFWAYSEVPTYFDEIPEHTFQIIDDSRDRLLPIFSALKLVTTSESPQEREYALKYLRYRAENLGIFLREISYRLITMAEDESQQGRLEQIIRQLEIRYPQITVSAGSLKEQIKFHIEKTTPSVLPHNP